MNERRINGVSISDILWIVIGLVVLPGLGAALARDESPSHNSVAPDQAAAPAITTASHADAVRQESFRRYWQHKENQMNGFVPEGRRRATSEVEVTRLNLDRDGADIVPTEVSSAPDITELNLDRNGGDIP